MDKISLSRKIREIAASSGIDALGFCAASAFPGYALSHTPRRDPKLSLPDAATIIVAGIYIGGITLPAWSNPWQGRTSRLYLSGYFSDIVEPLQPVARYLKDGGYQAMICNGLTDGGSIIPLKLAAVRAGLGWQGKNSLLVTKKFGTFLALGGVLTNAVLAYNAEEVPNRCGKCKKCQEACPVSALDEPYVLNRPLCLSDRLLKGFISGDTRSVVENRVGDCELCQQACPWNQKHLENPLPTKLTVSFQEKINTWEEIFHLSRLVKLTEDEYKEVFGIFNTGISYAIFHRNVQMAIERARHLDLRTTDRCGDNK